MVGRGDKATERLFKRKQLSEASDYAKQTRANIEALPNSAVCDSAIIALYAD